MNHAGASPPISFSSSRWHIQLSLKVYNLKVISTEYLESFINIAAIQHKKFSFLNRQLLVPRSCKHSSLFDDYYIHVMYTTWPKLMALRSARWSLGGETARSQGLETEGARKGGGGGDYGGMADGDGQHSAGRIIIGW